MNEQPAQLIDDLRLLQAPTPLWVWGLALLGLIAVAVMGLLIRRRLKSKQQAMSGRNVAETAIEDALADLEAARKLILAGNSKPYGIEVSRIVRRYIEVRFGIYAPRRSTEEFLTEAQSSSRLEANHRALLAKFLGACDLFKFGRTHAEPVELNLLHDAAVGFVSETRLVPVGGLMKEVP